MATSFKERAWQSARFIATTVLPHTVFWAWNAIFMCVIYFGLLKEILWPLLLATIDGPVPWDFTLFTLLVLLIPLLCTTFGALFFRREPLKLIGLFYGIEGPLMLLGICRLFLVREMTLGVAQLLVTFYVAAFFYLYELLRGHRQNRFTATVQLIGQSILLLTGLYIGTLIAFYVVPGLWAFLAAFFSFKWVHEFFRGLQHIRISELILLPLMLLLFGFSSLLFFGAPIAWVTIAVRSFQRVFSGFAQQFGRGRAVALSATTIGLLLATFWLCNRQPQGAAFALLASAPQSDAARQDLLQKESTIRRGLLNAYLAPFRYLSAVDECDHVETMYREVFHSEGQTPRAMQHAYNQLARPLLFLGHSMIDDQAKAEALYESFFDVPLQKAERDAVVRAIESTWSTQQREAGLIHQGQRKVWLWRQEITTTAHGDWAEIELHEVYENQTYEQQEIFYYFSLPESAAVTGLWLGDSADRKLRFPFTVAPRGAAQKVYKGEVSRRSDPALLEQIGPRQYRLRAFPIQPKPYGKFTSGPPMHLWLTYKTMAAGDRFPLPLLGERRNVYWSWQSQRTIDGKSEHFGSDWLPPAVGHASAKLAHEAVLSEGLVVRARPIDEAQLPLAANRAIAVVIDRSKSMARVAADVKRALGELQSVAAAQNDDLDFYLTSSPFRGEAPARIDDASALGPSATLFYGAQTSRDLLRQFDTLKRDKHYDAIIVLTDDGSLDLATDGGPKGMPAAPLYMVHLGEKLPPGYDDTTLAAIQKSGGGVTTSAMFALRRIAQQQSAPDGAVTSALDENGMQWSVEPAPPGAAPSADDGFSALAARQAILHRTRAAQLGQLNQLDALHAMAQHYGIVSAYSSMLVLVNDEQRELLKRAAAEKDRFERQVESGKEALQPPNNPLHVSGTPEPHEWLLLLSAAVMLAIVYRREKRRDGRVAAA